MLTTPATPILSPLLKKTYMKYYVTPYQLHKAVTDWKSVSGACLLLVPSQLQTTKNYHYHTWRLQALRHCRTSFVDSFLMLQLRAGKGFLGGKKKKQQKNSYSHKKMEGLSADRQLIRAFYF